MGKLSVITRAVGVLSAVTVLGAGVTYASLSTSASLTNNSVASATAGLLVDGSDASDVTSASEAGFAFTGLVPGGGFGAEQEFTLENTGDTNLKVSAATTVGTPSGAIDKTKVFFKFKNNGNSATATYTLAQLEANYMGLPGVSGVGESLGQDDPSTASADEGKASFKVSVKMDEDAIFSGSVSLTGFDIVFKGEAVVTP